MVSEAEKRTAAGDGMPDGKAENPQPVVGDEDNWLDRVRKPREVSDNGICAK